MAIPEQIRKQSEAVQELYKEIGGAVEAAGDNSDTNTEATANESNVNTTADGHTGAEDARNTSGNEQHTEANKDVQEDITQKYRTLQGMYNAEVPRLHSQNREMQNRLQQMEQLIASMSVQQPVQPSQDTMQVITAQDQEEYGESIDVMRRAATEVLGPMSQRIAQLERMVSQFQGSVGPQVQAITQRQAMTAEQQFWADLTTVVPNWREINNNQDFQSWLLQYDPLTGISRQTILEDAQRNLEVSRVGNFFKSWLEITGQANVAQNSQYNASSELERQVAPGKSRSTGTPTSSAPKPFSQGDIEKFYSDVRMGKYKGRDAERTKIERDIFTASREGRITANA